MTISDAACLVLASWSLIRFHHCQYMSRNQGHVFTYAKIICVSSWFLNWSERQKEGLLEWQQAFDKDGLNDRAERPKHLNPHRRQISTAEDEN